MLTDGQAWTLIDRAHAEGVIRSPLITPDFSTLFYLLTD
jgi:hypothetical protein